MGSLILELQQLITDTNTKTSVLLQKAYLIAKLKVTEFEQWIVNWDCL